MKIVKRVSFIIFIIFSLTYLFIVVTPRVFKNFYPFGIRTAIVTTGSMEPKIKINDYVVVKKPNDIKVGDIVSYTSKDTKNDVIHRIVKIDNNMVTTKGDANNTQDEPINKKQINGIYICKIKYLGNIIVLITKPIVFSVIMTTLVIFMFMDGKKTKSSGE